MNKVILTLLVIFWTNISFAEVVGLTCKLGDKKFYAGLDFTNNKWVNENGSGTYMSYTEDVITTVKRTKGDMNSTHSLWYLSRITGVGVIKGYKLTEKDLKSISDQQVIQIKRSMIGDLNNKSLEPARNKLRAHTFVEYLSSSFFVLKNTFKSLSKFCLGDALWMLFFASSVKKILNTFLLGFFNASITGCFPTIKKDALFIN